MLDNRQVTSPPTIREIYHKMAKPGYARIYPGLKTIQLAERGREHGG
jgi:hypothetical protein